MTPISDLTAVSGEHSDRQLELTKVLLPKVGLTAKHVVSVVDA